MTPPALPVHIGVFDSGLGGLSVLKALRAKLPAARLSYLADSGHAPYGERDAGFVARRTALAARFLRAQGAQMMVIACNTATAAGVAALRQAMPDWPIVGMEPGIKPALALTRNGRIGVMATGGTLNSPRFAALLKAVSAEASTVQFHLQACAGLAQAIEQHPLHGSEVDACIRHHAAPLRAAGCDVVVLGCTHYPLVAEQIQAQFGTAVMLVDTGEAVARRTVSVAAALAPCSTCQSDSLWTTGEPQRLQQVAARWAQMTVPARQVEL